MKVETNKKILEFLSVEILLQVGFEKTTEHALSLMTEVFIYYLESLIKRTLTFDSVNPEILIKYLIEEAYNTEQYQIKELSNFLDQQLLIKTQLKEKYDIDCNESLIHSLRILPQGVNLKSAFKNTENMTLEKKSLEVYHEINLDKFMLDFIERSSQEPGSRQIETYDFDCLTVLKDIIDKDEKPVRFEIGSLGARDKIFGYFDEILAEQELFIEDFMDNENCVVIK